MPWWPGSRRRLGVPWHDWAPCLDSGPVTAHEAARGGDSGPGRRHPPRGRQGARPSAPSQWHGELVARPEAALRVSEHDLVLQMLSPSLWCPPTCETMVLKTAPRAGTTPAPCIQLRSPHVPAAPLLWPPTSPGAGAGQSPGGCPEKPLGLLRQRRGGGGQVPAGFRRCGQALRQQVRFAFTQQRVSWGAAQPQQLHTEHDGEQARSEAAGKLQARAFHVVSGPACFQPA